MDGSIHVASASRWTTAVRSLLLVALLHRLDCLAFLAASSPVWLLAAFLLGVVLVHSEPNVPERHHLYKKIRHLACDDVPDDQEDNDSSSSEDTEHLVAGEKAVAWTADDEHSIQSIGSLELERDARLERLMSRRTIQRNLIDLDVHIPAVLAPRNKMKNPFQDQGDGEDAAADLPGSAPSSLLRNPNPNPFVDVDVQGDAEGERRRPPPMVLRRHESLITGPASRFRPYFVAGDKAVLLEEGGSDRSNSNNSPSSSSSSSSSPAGSDQRKAVVPPTAAAQEEPSSSWDANKVVAVDVELISDSSDDDMSLPGDGKDKEEEEEEEEHSDAFEVESITRQVVAAAGIGNQQQQEEAEPTTTLPPREVEEEGRRERAGDVSEIIPLLPPPVVKAVDAGAAPAAAEPAAPAPAPAGKPNSSKSKGASTSKKAVFGFFRK